MAEIKLQLSPNKIVKDATVIWNEHGPEVDVAMDPKQLTYRPGSVQSIYSFHVLDHLFPSEVSGALENWFKCLSSGGQLHVIVDDFEYIARGLVGGDINIEMVNDLHNHPTQYTKEDLIARLKKAGFPDDKQIIWYESSSEYPKAHYEIVIVATKP